MPWWLYYTLYGIVTSTCCIMTSTSVSGQSCDVDYHQFHESWPQRLGKAHVVLYGRDVTDCAGAEQRCQHVTRQIEFEVYCVLRGDPTGIQSRITIGMRSDVTDCDATYFRPSERGRELFVLVTRFSVVTFDWDEVPPSQPAAVEATPEMITSLLWTCGLDTWYSVEGSRGQCPNSELLDDRVEHCLAACPREWGLVLADTPGEAHHCYWASTEPANREAARRTCGIKGGTLLTVTSHAQWVALNIVLNYSSDERFWNDGQCFNGICSWHESYQELSFTPWSPGVTIPTTDAIEYVVMSPSGWTITDNNMEELLYVCIQSADYRSLLESEAMRSHYEQSIARETESTTENTVESVTDGSSVGVGEIDVTDPGFSLAFRTTSERFGNACCQEIKASASYTLLHPTSNLTLAVDSSRLRNKPALDIRTQRSYEGYFTLFILTPTHMTYDEPNHVTEGSFLNYAAFNIKPDGSNLARVNRDVMFPYIAPFARTTTDLNVKVISWYHVQPLTREGFLGYQSNMMLSTCHAGEITRCLDLNSFQDAFNLEFMASSQLRLRIDDYVIYQLIETRAMTSAAACQLRWPEITVINNHAVCPTPIENRSGGPGSGVTGITTHAHIVICEMYAGIVLLVVYSL